MQRKCFCVLVTKQDIEKTRQIMHCLWLLCFLMDPVDLSEICVVSVFDENMLKLNVLLFSVDNVNEYVIMRKSGT